jgi:hypothetical protein
MYAVSPAKIVFDYERMYSKIVIKIIQKHTKLLAISSKNSALTCEMPICKTIIKIKIIF